jgi:hypothetical protein
MATAAGCGYRAVGREIASVAPAVDDAVGKEIAGVALGWTA